MQVVPKLVTEEVVRWLMTPRVMEAFPTLDDLAQRPEWMERGACRDTRSDLFFPERGASTRQAKEMCRGCSVRQECIRYAMDATEEMAGIWGGTSARDRAKRRRTEVA